MSREPEIQRRVLTAAALLIIIMTTVMLLLHMSLVTGRGESGGEGGRRAAVGGVPWRGVGDVTTTPGTPLTCRRKCSSRLYTCARPPLCFAPGSRLLRDQQNPRMILAIRNARRGMTQSPY